MAEVKRVKLLQLMSCADGTECVIETLDANTTACVGDMCGLPYRAQCVGEQPINFVDCVRNYSSYNAVSQNRHYFVLL